MMTSLFACEVTVGYARIAVERGVDRYPDGLTYAIPRSMADLSPGERVIVPLGRGNQETAGYVIDLLEQCPETPGAVKAIDRRDAPPIRLPGQLLSLARWISSYYLSPIGMTLATMLPAAVKRRVGTVVRTMVDLAETPPPNVRPTAKQRAVLDFLATLAPAERPVERTWLCNQTGLKSAGPITRLEQAGFLRISHKSAVEAAWIRAAGQVTVPHRLTEDQHAIVESIGARLAEGFSAHLLYGVTGSGKTEVYLRLFQRVLEAGRAALLLVPEISLTPQSAGRLLARFPDRRVAILHSGLTAAQRHQQWRLAAEGGADLLVGARSAVFAPIPDQRLGLIVVDEEHDGSYKQDQVPRYHGRDVAIRRAQEAAIPVVLGSATPSLETWYNAAHRGTYHLHRLPRRVPGMALPAVRIVDFAQERRCRQDRRIHLVGPTLESAIGRTLDRGAQLLILLNRRGYASYIACPDQGCGWVMRCDQCDVSLVYHRTGDLPGGGYVQCHHCRSEQRLPGGCPTCGKRLCAFGFGTQRVEEELARKFPALVLGETMLRLDSDTMHSGRDYDDALERFGAGTVRALVGTQMIAKGLDYPGVQLVGVINADTAINLPDFRAAERTFQLVSQVAGRCGRSEHPGTVIVQTFNPTEPAIHLAASHDYFSFAERELVERQRCGLPPITRMARIVVRDAELARAVAAARRLAEGLTAILPAEIRLLGPAACPIARIAGRHRQQLELLAPTAVALQRLLAHARSAGLLKAGAEMAIDVDPVALL